MSKSRPWRRARRDDATRTDPPPVTDAVPTSAPPTAEPAARPGAEAAKPAKPAAEDARPGTAQRPAATAIEAVDAPPAPTRRRFRDVTALLLIQASHPRQALTTALLLGLVAGLTERPAREVALVFCTVLVGQVVLGWHNDLIDADTDRSHEHPHKPIADGRLDRGTAWFALCCGILLLMPLAIANGVVAGCCYLASVLIAGIGNIALRRGLLSFVPWTVSWALYAPFLSYGGWATGLGGQPPQPTIVGLFALLGLGVHVLCALWGLVADYEDGWTYLPIRIGISLGATRLLVLVLIYLAAVCAGLVYELERVGLWQ
ncbi:UbiA family prenyltransferase [Nocardioides insulae]|uniref:UbiA family prenyltransferase n=1 Tax=Nocardioides insulae TaxID=394734 RepID=UPI001B7FCAA1|nr:UbiA family prenyltransferase [Nocardioides insulae]